MSDVKRDVTIVQLQDKAKNPVSPYTPASSVYVNYNGEYSNVETVVGGININKVKNAQTSALEDIDDARIAGINKIDTEANSYSQDISTLKDAVNKLDDAVYPLAVSFQVSPNLSELTDTVSWSISEYGEAVTASTVVRRAANGGSDEAIHTGNQPSGSVSVPITWGRDKFSISATKGSKSTSKQETRYLCVFGAYGAEITADIIKNASYMERKYTYGSSFTASVNTTSDKQYIWVAVPEYLSITKITSAGFDVTMNSYVNIQVGDINYRAYRTANELQAAAWSLVIS